MSSIMKGPFPTTVLVGDWGSYYNTLLRNVVVIINTFWDRGPKDLTVDIHKALATKDYKRAAILTFAAFVICADDECSWILQKIAFFRTEIVANFEPIEWIWEKADCNAYLPAGHHYDKQKSVRIFATATAEVGWSVANKANARSLNLGWGWAESTRSTVSHMTPAVSKIPDINSNREESNLNAEKAEIEQVLDWEDPRLLLPDSDPWASWRLEDIFPLSGRNQKSNVETRNPQPASHLGPINGTPFAWCVRCVKRIGKEGHEPCSRSNSYEECRYCQKTGKLCVSVPVPLRGDVTNLLLLTPDRQPAAVAAFARKANAYHEAVGNSPDTQKLVVMQSLNRNIFRLVNAMRAASGQPVFPDEEEQVWPEVHGGVVDGTEKGEGGWETHEDVVDGNEDWYFE